MVLMGREFGRRTVAIFWCAVIGIVSGVLIYLQMIPLLYVLATLALAVLLLVVAFSDLENVGRDSIDGQ
jgi:choline-glycine betaine transporter